MPELSSAAGRGHRAEFNALFFRGLRVIALLLIPAAVIGALFARPLLQPLLSHGELTTTSLDTTARTLSAFVIGLPGFSAFALCMRALQARRDMAKVFWLYVLENGVNIVLAFALYPSMHAPGLAYAYAVAYTVAAAASYVVVMRTDGPGEPLRFAASGSPTPDALLEEEL